MSYNYKEIESVNLLMCYEEIEYCLSEQRLANLKTSVVWAIWEILYKVHINPRCIEKNQVSAIALHNTTPQTDIRQLCTLN